MVNLFFMQKNRQSCSYYMGQTYRKTRRPLHHRLNHNLSSKAIPSNQVAVGIFASEDIFSLRKPPCNLKLELKPPINIFNLLPSSSSKKIKQTAPHKQSSNATPVSKTVPGKTAPTFKTLSLSSPHQGTEGIKNQLVNDNNETFWKRKRSVKRKEAENNERKSIFSIVKEIQNIQASPYLIAGSSSLQRRNFPQRKSKLSTRRMKTHQPDCIKRRFEQESNMALEEAFNNFSRGLKHSRIGTSAPRYPSKKSSTDRYRPMTAAAPLAVTQSEETPDFNIKPWNHQKEDNLDSNLLDLCISL